jgi:nucleoside-diphosphate kinase
LLSLILLKPEAIQRNLVGKIICFIEDKGLKMVGLKMITPDEKQIQQLYSEHTDYPHYEDLINLTTNGPVIAIAIELPVDIDSGEQVKNLQGKHDINGTIRFFFSLHPSRGVIHCSSQGEGAREVSIFFSEEEIANYYKDLDDWIVFYSNNHSVNQDGIKKEDKQRLNKKAQSGKADLLIRNL